MKPYDILINALTEQYATRTAAAVTDKGVAAAIRGSLFPQQRDVLDDGNRFKSVLCPRRGGKSYTALSGVFHTALTKPTSKSVIVTLTLKSAKNIYWLDIQRFAQRFGIDVSYNHTELKVTLKNGSQFFLIGAESRAEIEKLRGGSYDLVIIDECKSYPSGLLEELITDVIKPALMDRGGSLWMIGTPGNVLDGLFYRATYQGLLDPSGKPYSRTYSAPEEYWVRNPQDKGGARVRWSRHSWTIQDNKRTQEDLWDAALQEKLDNNWNDDHPTWQREYLGQWVPAHDVFVYAYATLHQSAPDRVHWTPARSRENPAGLPETSKDWRFILGADLGYEDDFAAVVAAYSPTADSLYHVWDFKTNHQDVYSIAEILQQAWDKFGGFDAMVADASGLGKLVVETLSSRHGLPVQAAEKREKFDHIELLNADFHAGKIKIIPGTDLATELAALQFDLTKHSKLELVRTGKLRENPSLPNHLCDALLYLWRFSNHFWSAPKRQQYAHGSPEWVDAQEAAWIDRMKAERDTPTSFFEKLSRRSVDPLAGFYRK